jgi:nitrogen fixation NifU-like protein
MNVTDHEIEEAVLEGARSYHALQEHTKLGTVCGQCRDEAERLLDEYVRKHFAPAQ